MDVIIPTIKNQTDIMPLVDAIIRTAGMDINIIATCREVCAAKNRNIGLEKSTGDIVCMIDDDICGLPQNWLADMLAVWNAYPNCVMASPRLMRTDGLFGSMIGYPVSSVGLEVIESRELPSACILMINAGLRFDEEYIGSGFEDSDMCRQLKWKFPSGIWICNHAVKVVHKNEMKNQTGENYKINLARFTRKWQTES